MATKVIEEKATAEDSMVDEEPIDPLSINKYDPY